MVNTKLKIGLTSALAVGCASLTYVFLKKYAEQYGTDFRYLNIQIIKTEDTCEAVVKELRRRCVEYRAIGFDCEWVTEHGKRQPVALIQLSSYDGYCGLFRVCQMENIPSSLKDLLEDDSIYKVGVAPVGDAKYLAQDYGVYVCSTLDIRHLVQLCGYEAGGLAALAKSLLGATLDKTWRIRCSDWAADELTDRQIKYAALDAHVAIKILVKVMNEYCNKGLVSWLRNGANKCRWSDTEKILAQYADMTFNLKQVVKKGDLIKEKEAKGKKELVVTKGYPHAMRSKPLYHNCFLKAPDSDLLCTCDIKKAHWYVEKNLADVVCEDPFTVQLRFEPAGRSVGDVGRYYQLTKENKCVVCGSGNSYIRKNVVPREYRRYFPDIMKEHSSHDVVLLCGRCHQRSNVLDQAVRERLAAACGAPFAVCERSKVLEDAACKKVRSAARALLFQSKKHVLPAARRRQLEATLLQHFAQHDQVTQALLEQAANMQVAFDNADYESHGFKVVQHYQQNCGLLKLEEMWRVHFLDSMKPRHMPELWSLKHNEERLRVRLNEGRLSEEDRKLLF